MSKVPIPVVCFRSYNDSGRQSNKKIVSYIWLHIVQLQYNYTNRKACGADNHPRSDAYSILQHEKTNERNKEYFSRLETPWFAIRRSATLLIVIL
jgi:hypothetical protein